MGENATRVQRTLRKRLADAHPRFRWMTEYDVGGTPVDVAGESPDGDGALVVLELEWRRADPADNTAKLFATSRAENSTPTTRSTSRRRSPRTTISRAAASPRSD